MHTPHSLTHPHSLYPTNYTSLTFIQTHSQSSFKAHSSPHSASSSHIHTQTHSYFNAHSSHILTHAHTLNLHLMHTTLTLTHLHSLCPTNYNPLTITHTLSIPLIYTLTHPHSIFPTIRLTLYHSYTTPFTHTWTQSSWHFDFPWHVTLRRRGAPQRIQNLTLSQSFTPFDTHSDIVIFYMNDKIRSILNDHLVTAIPIDKIMYKTFKM